MSTITIVGRLTADPQLRFLPTGDAVASFTVAQNNRRFDKATSQWVDDEALFMRVECWRQLAEGAADGLHKGSEVVVVGELKPDNYEKDGQKRFGVKLAAKSVGASVRARREAAPAETRQEEMAW